MNGDANRKNGHLFPEGNKHGRFHSTIISQDDKFVNANSFQNDNIHQEHVPCEAFSVLAYDME